MLLIILAAERFRSVSVRRNLLRPRRIASLSRGVPGIIMSFPAPIALPASASPGSVEYQSVITTPSKPHSLRRIAVQRS